MDIRRFSGYGVWGCSRDVWDGLRSRHINGEWAPGGEAVRGDQASVWLGVCVGMTLERVRVKMVFVLQLSSVGCFGGGAIAWIIGGVLEVGMAGCGGFCLFSL